MKIGDRVPVMIAGQVVANAEIRELSDGTATLIVPATRVVMATRTELTQERPATEPAKETVITGVERGTETGTAHAVDEGKVEPQPVEATENVESAPVASSDAQTSETQSTEPVASETPEATDAKTE